MGEEKKKNGFRVGVKYRRGEIEREGERKN